MSSVLYPRADRSIITSIVCTGMSILANSIGYLLTVSRMQYLIRLVIEEKWALGQAAHNDRMTMD